MSCHRFCQGLTNDITVRTVSKGIYQEWPMSHPNTSTRLVLLGLVVLLAQFHNMILRAMDRPPNILVILSDDQGWGDLSLNGNTNLATLRIDSLASDGAMFQHFFVFGVAPRK